MIRDQLGLFSSDENGRDPAFDPARARAARDEAVERVDRNAEEDWKQAARDAIETVARYQRFLTTDDVWEFLVSQGAPVPHEPRALGPMMTAAARAGVIEATDDFRLSRRSSRHHAPLRIWRSKL